MTSTMWRWSVSKIPNIYRGLVAIDLGRGMKTGGINRVLEGIQWVSYLEKGREKASRLT